MREYAHLVRFFELLGKFAFRVAVEHRPVLHALPRRGQHPTQTLGHIRGKDFRSIVLSRHAVIANVLLRNRVAL